MRADVGTWLYRIVANAALDALRSSRRRKARAEAEPAPEPPAAGSVEDARLALRELAELLSALPENQRVAIILKEIEGLAVNEIADHLSCSVGAVEQRLVRAWMTLRAKWGQ